MKLRRIAWTALAGLAVLFLTLNVSAKNGRDFAGVYSVSNVVDQGNQMLLTLHVRVHNNSAADVKQAVLTLREFGGGPLGTFQPVKLWRNHGEVHLTQQFIVPKREFESWHKGTQPELMVVTHDQSGQRYDRFVQLSSRPALPR